MCMSSLLMYVSFGMVTPLCVVSPNSGEGELIVPAVWNCFSGNGFVPGVYVPGCEIMPFAFFDDSLQKVFWHYKGIGFPVFVFDENCDSECVVFVQQGNPIIRVVWEMEFGVHCVSLVLRNSFGVAGADGLNFHSPQEKSHKTSGNLLVSLWTV